MPPGTSNVNQNLFHLRRIPPNKCRSDPSRGVEATLILLDTHTKFGRNPEKCDVVLTSSVFSSSNMISRDHADIIGVKGASGRIEKYHINDRSLNGTYINDQRVNSTMQIMEGDVIKFGHMNGAAVRPGQTAPQANAEFAFMVERANPSYDYIGFVDGRRGDVARPTVMQSTKAPPVQNASQNLTAPSTTASVSSTAGANPMAGLMWPGTLGYNQSLPGFAYSGFPMNPAYLQPPQWAQHLQVLQQQAQQSGFRVPDVFGATACMGSSNGPPSTSASLFPLTQRGFSLQQAQQNLMQDDKTSTTTHIVQGKETEAVNPPATVKVPVASPPMECDSSVPSPPKTTVATTVSTAPSASQTTRSAASPLRKEGESTYRTWVSYSLKFEVVEDVRSERSFVESPQPPRAPAPAPWDSTPSPRPRDYSPDRESTATRDTEKDRDYDKEKEQREAEREKEEAREQSKKKPTKEVRAGAPNQSRPRTKTNEIARLLDDLCEGSWANTVRRVSSSSRRPTEEAIIERNSKKEKKKMEKNRKKERSREQRASIASSSVSSVTTSGAAKPARRKLKQLSDDSSSGSSSDSEEVIQPVRKTAAVEKKKAEVKRKRVSPPASDVSSNRYSDSGSDSEERISSKKGNKRRFPSSEKKSSEKKKSHASNSVTSVTKKKAKAASRKREDTNTDEEAITQHDPSTTCALNAECTRPQSEQVGWIFCDDCQNWFHNICILGREEAPDDEFFYCGCKAKKKTKKR
ncbi:FHA domain protein [Ostertagia ostertagi]